MLTGYNADTPDEVEVDAGVLYYDVAGTATILGPSRGGFKFDPGRAVRVMEYDGQGTPTVGDDRTESFESVISGKLIQINSTTETVIEPGATVTGTTTKTVTPKAAKARFAAGDYITNLILVTECGDGTYQYVTFAKAYCRKYTKTTQDKNEAEYDCEFVARLASGTAKSVCPYTKTYTAALPDAA